MVESIKTYKAQIKKALVIVNETYEFPGRKSLRANLPIKEKSDVYKLLASRMDFETKLLEDETADVVIDTINEFMVKSARVTRS